MNKYLLMGLMPLFSFVAQAQSIPVNFIYQQSEYATRASALADAKWAVRTIRNYKIPIKMGRFIVSRWAYTPLYSERKQHLSNWQNYLNSRPYEAPIGVPTVVMSKPMTDEVSSGYYLGGGAMGICRLTAPSTANFAIAYIAGVRSGGERSRGVSRYIMIHELMHLLGASHVESAPNLMSTFGLAFYPNVPVFQQSIQQVNECIADFRS